MWQRQAEGMQKQAGVHYCCHWCCYSRHPCYRCYQSSSMAKSQPPLWALGCHILAQTCTPVGQVSCLLCMLPAMLSGLNLCVHSAYLLCSCGCTIVPLNFTYNTQVQSKNLWRISKQPLQIIKPMQDPGTTYIVYMFCC